MNTPVKLALLAATAAAVLAGCGGGSSDGGSGTVAVALTDAPACGFDAVNVTVTKVRVHQSASAGTNDAGWTDITVDPARKINLVDLSNGVLEALGQATLPAGHYTQLRLVLAADNTGSGLANSVLPSGGVETVLTTPSAAQSGIKLVGQFDVTANATTNLVLDFDACKSVVTRGNGGYNLKPVITLSDQAVSGSISGYLDPALVSSHAVVNAELNGEIVKSTVPAANGSFTLSPLPQTATGGNYAVVITADAHASEIINNVPVTALADTAISTSAKPVTLPASTVNTVSGTVLPVTATPTLTASQSLTGGPTVVIAYQNADAVSGAYSMSLPAAAPLVGQFGTLPIATTADTAVAGKYTVTAAGSGVQSQSSAADVSSAGATLSFTLK